MNNHKVRMSETYYHIMVNPKEDFTLFISKNVDRNGFIKEISGRKLNGNLAIHKWLISKNIAHIDNNRLVPDLTEAKKFLQTLRGNIRRINGDIFQVKLNEEKI